MSKKTIKALEKAELFTNTCFYLGISAGIATIALLTGLGVGIESGVRVVQQNPELLNLEITQLREGIQFLLFELTNRHALNLLLAILIIALIRALISFIPPLRKREPEAMDNKILYFLTVIPLPNMKYRQPNAFIKPINKAVPRRPIGLRVRFVINLEAHNRLKVTIAK